jgi:hypothetical protein
LDRAVAANRLSRLARWLLGSPLTIVLAVLCAVQLAAWIPHYITWPMWSDDDAYTTLAQGWDAGRLPYRDLRCNNFPGTMYAFWVLGRLFGWGRTAVWNTTDAALVVAFGVALIVWSRRCFRMVLPGIVGYLTFLSFYLSLDYSQTNQRDWHGPLFAVAATLLAHARYGRGARIATALAVAAAWTIRPQTILFWPAVLVAIHASARQAGASRRQIMGAYLEWAIAVVLFLGVLFAPLLHSGVLADFVHAVSITSYGGHYNRVTARSIVAQWLSQITALQFVLVPAVIVALSRLADSQSRRAAAISLTALAMVSLYRPLSPFAHAYLKIPLMVVWPVIVAVLVQLVAAVPWPSPVLRLSVVLLVISLGITPRPRFCAVGPSIRAVRALMTGSADVGTPPGYSRGVVPSAAYYPWDDYRAVLSYIEEHTTKKTLVANALKGVPALTGPTGRQPAFPAESIEWLWMVEPDDEPEFARSLARADDAVVVWAPGEIGPDASFTIRTIEAVIRERYAPEAQFGPIAVWRRTKEK